MGLSVYYGYLAAVSEDPAGVADYQRDLAGVRPMVERELMRMADSCG